MGARRRHRLPLAQTASRGVSWRGPAPRRGMSDMSETANVGSRARLTLAAAVCLLLVVPAAPAAAQDDQSASISQSCSSDGGVSAGNGSASAGDVCAGGQERVIQQSDEDGDTDAHVTQTRRFRKPRHRRDDFRVDDTSVDEFSCEDLSDPNNLDSDGDGEACEDTFTEVREVRSVPDGGVETGGGGTLPSGGGTTADVAKVAGPPLALALIVGGLLGLRRGRLS